MKTSPDRPSDIEIRYLYFINNTLQIDILRAMVGDEFSRKIFDYLEDEPLFDAQVFCAFLYHFILKCIAYKNLVAKGKININVRNRLNKLSFELAVFLELQSGKFSIPLLYGNEPDLKAGQVKLLLAEKGDYPNIYPYKGLEFTLPPFSVEQRLDIIHFMICAVNRLSQKDKPIETFRDSRNPYIRYISEPAHWKVIPDELISARELIINRIFREKGKSGNKEFDESLPDIKRILQAQKQDPKIEKQWLDENSPVFVKPEIEAVAEKAVKTKGYPPHHLQQIKDTAVRLYELKDKVRAIDIYTELGIGKNTYNDRIRYFDYDTPKILYEARAIVRERER
jgi:hypothetical protein